MKRAWAWWVELTSRRERGTTLALFRIAVAAVMVTMMLSAMRAGIVDLLWVDASEGGIKSVASGFWLLDLVGGATQRNMWGLVVLTLLFGTAMMLGLGGRCTVLAAVWCYRAVSSAGHGNGGYDAMIFNGAWLLFLAEPTATLSLDARLRTGRWRSDVEVSAWPRYLLILQLLIIYTATGLQKSSASWTFADGFSALYWFLQDPNWQRWDTSWTGSGYPLTQLATAVVWHFEVFAGLLLLVYHVRANPDRKGRWRAWLRRVDGRKIFTAIGIGMHAGIALLMDMGPFSWISMAFYITLWGPEEWEQVGSWLIQLARDRRPGSARAT